MKAYNIEVFHNGSNSVSIFQSATGFSEPKDAYREDNLIVLTPEQAQSVCREIIRVAKECLVAQVEAEEKSDAE